MTVEAPANAPGDYASSLVQAAVMYADAGLPVFPVYGPAKVGACACPKGRECDSPGKHPISHLVPHGFQNASTDELNVRRWWKAEPRANVAIAVPSGYAVLDIDGPEGLDALAAANFVIPPTPTVATGKGWHHWFRTAHDLQPRAHMLAKVDLRGPGSYVVAPPSLHASGRQYEWERPPTELEFADAPQWLYELATRPSSAGDSLAGRIDVASVLEGVPEGQRDAQLFRAASKLRYGDVPYEWALQMIEEAAARCSPPFPKDQAKLKVDSAYGRYQPTIKFDSDTGPGHATLVADDRVRVELSGPNGPVEFLFSDLEKIGSRLETELSVQLLMPGTLDDVYAQRIDLLSHSARDSARREIEAIFGAEQKGVWARLINRAVSQAQRVYLGQDRTLRVKDIAAPLRVEYLVHELLLEDRPTVLFGPGGSLKTYMLMSLMLAMATGGQWLGRYAQRRNCLLVDYETGPGMTGLRFRRLARALNLVDVPSNIFVWHAAGVPLQDLIDPIRRSIERNNIGFIGIDHCAAACGGEPEKSDSALRFYRSAGKFRLPVAALAHVTGDVLANPDLGRRPFGSVFWDYGAGLTWFLQKEEQDEGDPTARIGMFQRKWNDTGRVRDFSVEVQFDGDAGPVLLSRGDLRESAVLMRTRGGKHVIFEALRGPMDVEELASEVNMPANTVKSVLQRNPRMFERTRAAAGGPGAKQIWQRKDAER